MNHRSRTILRATWAAIGLALGLLTGGIASVSCGKEDPGTVKQPPPLGTATSASSSGGIADDGAGGAESSSGAIGASSGGSAIVGGGTSDAGAEAGPFADDDAACATESLKGQVFPVDLFIMMDQSGSMTDTVTGPNGTTGQKWAFLTQAFTTFLEDPKSAGIGVGIQYFPIPNTDAPDSSCTASTYAVTNDPAQPASGQGVPIAPLPGNAAPIIASLQAHIPGGSTPTLAALTGALQYAGAWATQNPTHKVVVVLATDGVPHLCPNNTIATVSAAAQAGFASVPSIPTYVIGIGDSLDSLNEIADAGGTTSAFIVSTGQDTAGQFLSAMNSIRSATAIPCALTIPTADGGAVDYAKVNVVDTPSDGGPPNDFYQVTDSSQCATQAGGWYYDSNAAPMSINLCKATCDFVSVGLTDEVDIVLGCKTITTPGTGGIR